MKKIALEEAYAVPGVAKYTPQLNSLPEFPLCRERLEDLAELRLAAMDKGEIELSVVSATSPATQGVVDASLEASLSREWNYYVANAIEPNKKRLRAFAALPMRNPDEAITELTYAVKELGMVGALLNGYDDAGGNEEIYYDAPEYLDFWKTAAALDVPIYIHPRVVPPNRVTTYKPYPELGSAAWGFHVETGEHIMRIIMSGLFDKVPDAKIIIGHMGEFLPFWCWRIDHRFKLEEREKQLAEAGRPLKLSVTDYVKKLYITTSGFFNTPALKYAMVTMPKDHIMFSVDYPYESYVEANEWWNTVDLDNETKEAIAFKNAELLLKL